MRWALTQAVHVHVRYETNLTRFYRSLARRKTRQEAVMATARKMLKVVYWMLRNEEPYHPGPEVYDPLAGGRPRQRLSVYETPSLSLRVNRVI